MGPIHVMGISLVCNQLHHQGGGRYYNVHQLLSSINSMTLGRFTWSSHPNTFLAQCYNIWFLVLVSEMNKELLGRELIQIYLKRKFESENWSDCVLVQLILTTRDETVTV